MSKHSVIRVMISSRCNDSFPANGGRRLSEIRKDLKQEIEGFRLFERQVFEVWINEDEPPQPGTVDSWETCLEAVRKCDILLVLSNGNAGWAKQGGDVGICHAELMTGLSQAPGKVRLISLGMVPISQTPEGQRNKRFQEYIKSQNLFRGAEVKSEEELTENVKHALYDAVVSLVHAGVRDISKGKFHSGQALDWSRLDFSRRREEMRHVLLNAMLQRKGSKLDEGHLLIKLGGDDIVTVADAIPAALSVSAAKEMVGQPFLNDYKLAGVLKKRGRGGPIHIIACHKTATESQAIRLLGFPDATVVSAPFGVFVADNIQKVQFSFIVNCRDETTTRHGIQRFFEWLEQTGEERLVAKRARSRARIVSVIAKEMDA